ncbi:MULTISPECIES: META domain-containing protein [unclassified Variovorax]|uniref:META domain-containing protein n=1 Tax=unclassified Variovorax TaxID=663243 RepID=UPI003F4682A9
MRSFARLARFSRGTALPTLATAALLAALSACGSGISLDEPIEGPAWRLVQLGDEPVAPNSDALLQFDRSSGRLSGSGGCNRISGTYTRSGVTLKIGQVASTRMACADPARGATEAQFISVLQGTASYRLAGPGRLVLLDASGRTVAALSTSGR